MTKPKQFAVPITDIIVTRDRGRKKFTGIRAMAESIEKYGLIHPIVVTPVKGQSGKYMLVAGERRYRACLMACVERVPASLREGSASLMAEIELEENVCRSDITWEEEGIQLKKIQDLKKTEDPKWTQEDTAQMTGRSTGDVSGKIKMAKKLAERPDLREKTDGKPYTAVVKIVEQVEEAEKVQRLADQGQIQLTTDLQLGDCRELIGRLKPKSVDLLLTDPPYGVEKIEQVRKSGSERLTGHTIMSETHNLTLDKIVELLKQLAVDLHRVMKPGAHFYMFCGFQYVGDFIHALSPHLEFQPPLLVWDRGKPSAPGYGYNYLSRLEAVIYGCRPPRGRRLNEQKYNLFSCPDVPKNLRMYPTEKPVPLLQTFIKNSTSANGLVLDPFAGSASTLTAARESGRRAIGFEIDETAYLRAQKRLAENNND